MHLQFLVIASLVLSLMSFADEGFAQKKKRSKARKKPKKVEVVQQEETGQDDSGDDEVVDKPIDNSSYGMRSRKKIGVGLAFTPLSDFALAIGATGTYSVSPQLQVGAILLSGSDDITDRFDNDDPTGEITVADIDGLAFWLSGRYFIGNSFNVMGGLGYRSAAMSLRIEDTTNGEFLQSDFKISSIVAPLAIGNHWTFESGFSIGVDWIAYMLALSGSASGSTNTNAPNRIDGTLEDFNDDVVDLADQLAKTSTFTLLLTSIGYQF